MNTLAELQKALGTTIGLLIGLLIGMFLSRHLGFWRTEAIAGLLLLVVTAWYKGAAIQTWLRQWRKKAKEKREAKKTGFRKTFSSEHTVGEEVYRLTIYDLTVKDNELSAYAHARLKKFVGTHCLWTVDAQSYLLYKGKAAGRPYPSLTSDLILETLNQYGFLLAEERVRNLLQPIETEVMAMLRDLPSEPPSTRISSTAS